MDYKNEKRNNTFKFLPLLLDFLLYPLGSVLVINGVRMIHEPSAWIAGGFFLIVAYFINNRIPTKKGKDS